MPVGRVGPAAKMETSQHQRRNKQKTNNTMSNESSAARSHEKWARFRFSLVGPLLAAPPKRGELKTKLQELAAQKWLHPISGQWADFGLSRVASRENVTR